MARRGRRENIVVDGVGRQDFLKTPAEACRKTEWPPIKWIAARVHIGTAKGAKTVLHELAQGHHQRKPPSATERCAQLEFQSTVLSDTRTSTRIAKWCGKAAVDLEAAEKAGS